jgi:hypothetical protein
MTTLMLLLLLLLLMLMLTLMLTLMLMLRRLKKKVRGSPTDTCTFQEATSTKVEGERCSTVTVLGVHVRALLQQCLDDLGRPHLSGSVERCLAVHVCGVYVRAFLAKHGSHLSIPVGSTLSPWTSLTAVQLLLLHVSAKRATYVPMIQLQPLARLCVCTILFFKKGTSRGIFASCP